MTKLLLHVRRKAMPDIDDYRYELSPDRIALFPLSKRDESKLLVYRHGVMVHEQFRSLPDLLPEASFLFFNDTRVIPARIRFVKETGAEIEIFLLSPVSPSTLLSQTMQSTSACKWKCTIGNVKRWNAGTILQKTSDGGTLSAALEDKVEGIVHFRWEGGKSFAEIVAQAGETPLPPYLKRAASTQDRTRYQTIYSHYDGAVAAPTAGLHFTENVFEELKKKNLGWDFVTLHVSAGTFQPVKAGNIDEHVMHGEQIVVSRKNIENLLSDKFVIAVGTTSMRTVESLYWFGVRLLNGEASSFSITQKDPYRIYARRPSPAEALQAILHFMDESGDDTLVGHTSIFIKPGYSFRICRGLITNFHQPASTLILLVAAFVGRDWKTIYKAALNENYRFLSYGDSSLLIP